MCKGEGEFLLKSTGRDRTENRGGGFKHRDFRRVDQKNGINIGKATRNPRCNTGCRITNVTDTLPINQNQSGATVRKAWKSGPRMRIPMNLLNFMGWRKYNFV